MGVHVSLQGGEVGLGSDEGFKVLILSAHSLSCKLCLPGYNFWAERALARQISISGCFLYY